MADVDLGGGLTLFDLLRRGVAWFVGRRPDTGFAYEAVEPDELAQKLPQFREHTDYVPREGINHAELAEEPRLVLYGPSACGKTREAIKIATKIAKDALHPPTIYRPLGALHVPTKRPDDEPRGIILLVDDLPRKTETAPTTAREFASVAPTVTDRLGQTVEWFEGWAQDGLAVIVTLREEHWDTVEEDLKEAGFRPVHLGRLTAREEKDYLASACKAWGFEAPEEPVAQAFAAENPGDLRPFYAFLQWLREQQPDVRRLSLDQLDQFRQKRDQLRDRAYAQDLTLVEQDVMEVLSALRVAEMPLHRELVVPCYPAVSKARFLTRSYRRQLAAAVKSVGRKLFTIGDDGEVVCHDGWLNLDRDDPKGEAERLAQALTAKRLRLRPGGLHAAALYAVARRLLDLDSPVIAAEATTRLVKLAPNVPHAAHLAGYAHDEAAVRGRSGERIQAAIGYYQRALQVWTEEAHASDWATTQNNLGIAWGNLPTGDRAENIKKAIQHFENALRVYTEDDFPQDWAMAQDNLGIARGDLPTGDRAENLQDAIQHYENALRVYTEDDFPQQWAMTQNNLGTAWAELPTGGRAENLRKAIQHFENAVRVYKEDDFAQQWAITQNNLGAAWADLPTGDRAENIQRAIRHFQNALRVRTEEDFPQHWATTQNNLANAWGQLPTGDRAENLRTAIQHYENALTVLTPEAFPEYHEIASEGLRQAREALAALEEADEPPDDNDEEPV